MPLVRVTPPLVDASTIQLSGKEQEFVAAGLIRINLW
jgi:hypothetical protein